MKSPSQVSATLYNTLGQVIKSEELKDPGHPVSWATSGFASGQYILKIRSGREQYNVRVQIKH
jgi:hypothetical protein